jgi:N-acetylglucosamine-6-phosphate deacetylase
MTLLRHARLVLPEGTVDGAWLHVDGDRIAAFGPEGDAADHPGLRPPVDTDEVDLTGHYVVAGFVDMHVHGGGGVAYSSGEIEQAREAFGFHLAHGTTTSIASTVTGTMDELERQVSDLAGLVEDGLLAGLHLEGPFISKARCGAHNPSLLRAPEARPLHRLIAAGRGTVRMVTLAPELEHGLDAVEQLVDAGVIAAIGHTDATYAQADAAIARGARVATHLFNGMRGLHHREPGPVTASLRDDDVVVEIVNDGIHVHPAVIDVVFKAVGAHRVALITDAMSAAGAADGLYPLGTLTVRVSDGVAKLVDQDTLAGSTLTMDAAFRRAVHEVGLPIEVASIAASLTPARALGIDDQVGSIELGKRADLVVCDKDLRVTRVMRRGGWTTAARQQPASSGVRQP